MARRVGWTEVALADLGATAEFIGRVSEQYGRAFVRDDFAASDSLADLGERGRVVPEFTDPQIRELFVRNHRLVYRVTPDEVIVLGLVHGARDLAVLWKRESR